MSPSETGPAMNHRIVLVRRPHGPVAADCFTADVVPVQEPADGQALVRTLYLSIDPTMRGWMTEAGNYMPGVALGDPVRCFGVGEVVESRTPALPEGSLAYGFTGWQDYALMGDGDPIAPIALPSTISPSDALSVYGITGLTAFFGLTDIGVPQPGETVVISGAAGGVGSIAVQVARILGARVVGIAGTNEKCRWVVDGLGAEACIDYRTEDVGRRLGDLCPDGIDVYFDNVGGEILEAALDHLALRARVVLCGSISTYNATEPVPGPRNLSVLVNQHARMEGFLLTHYLDRIFDGILQLGEWVAEGRIVNRIDVVDGLANAPTALERLFTGANIGKQLVKVADAGRVA